MARKQQQTDKQPSMVFWQKPNRWAWIAIISWLWARTFQDSGLLDFLGLLVFYPAAGYWAYLEITSGRSSFRRGLGVVVAILVAISLIKRIV